MENILDFDNIEVEKKFKLFRKFAILLEWIPILLSVIFFFIGINKYLFYCISVLSAIYVFGSWYLFKTENNKWYHILLSTFCGFLIFIVLTGIIFYFMNWDNASEMLIMGYTIAYYGSIFTFILGVIRTINSKNRLLELRMSWKIFSRFFILLVIYNFTEMKEPFMQIMNSTN